MHAEIFESAEDGTLKVAPHSIPHLQHCPLIPIAAPASTLPTRVESPLWKEGSSARPPTCFSQFMLKSVAPSVLRVSLRSPSSSPARSLAFFFCSDGGKQFCRERAERNARAPLSSPSSLRWLPSPARPPPAASA